MPARRWARSVSTCPSPVVALPPVARQVEAARRLEAAGYRAAWTNETVGGKDTMVQVATLLGATAALVLGTGIANVWARAPQTAHAAAASLAEAYPGRVVLGLGAGHPPQAAAVGRDYGRPRAVLRDYVERMDAPTVPPAPNASYARILGAQGPRMLALAAEIPTARCPRCARPASPLGPAQRSDPTSCWSSRSPRSATRTPRGPGWPPTSCTRA